MTKAQLFQTTVDLQDVFAPPNGKVCFLVCGRVFRRKNVPGAPARRAPKQPPGLREEGIFGAQGRAREPTECSRAQLVNLVV
jgi:hypothetical protein